GQRRLGPARVVADRPGRGARAVRPDGHRAALVETDDAAAAGADLRDVDERELDRVAAALHELAAEVDPRADLVLARSHRLAVLDERGLRRRTAHVERDQVRPAGLPAEVAAGDHAGGGAGL